MTEGFDDELERLRSGSSTDEADKRRRALADAIARAHGAYWDGPKRGQEPAPPPPTTSAGARRKRMGTGIPTMYAGIQFRSRLEAKWAAFFDLCGWEWDYEPFDLAGYIPDFVLRFKEPLLVEVKPVSTESEAWRELLDVVRPKVIDSGWEKELVMVGAGPWTQRGPHMDGAGATVGLIREREWMPDEYGEATFQVCDVCGRHTISNGSFYFRCRVAECGADAKMNSAGDPSDALRFWREACNRTQWKPPEMPR